ncbi:Nif11-like leader peptide family natural product precursor [Xanthobacteraceae bacterium A53D]
MSKQDVQKFRSDVEKDAALRSELEAQKDKASFVSKAVELGKARGYSFGPEHVDEHISEQGGALSDEALRSVAGGAKGKLQRYTYSRPGCN